MTLFTDSCGPQRMNSNYYEAFEFIKCYQQIDVFSIKCLNSYLIGYRYSIRP